MSFSIGLDLGTGAVKGVLWDGSGIVSGDSVPVSFLREGDAVEIDPLPYRDAVFGLIRRLAAAASGPVSGIAMCAASGNTLITDGNGTPRSRIISWLDARRETVPPDDSVHEVIGWPWNSGFPFAHLKRMRRENPEMFAPGFRVCMNNDWLQYCLCGVSALDESSATPFYLQDQRRRCYHAPYLALLSLKEEQLPRLVPSGTVIGLLRPELAEGNLTEHTKIVAGSFDHPSAARACGVTHPGELLLSCGTSWVGFHPAEHRCVRPRVLIDPFLSRNGGCWGEIVSWSKAGLELEAWITAHFSSGPDRYRKMNDDALAGGPAMEMMRQTARKFRDMAFPGAVFSKVVLAGGPSESPAWRRAIAESWNCVLTLSPYGKYSGAVGAAMLAKEGDAE